MLPLTSRTKPDAGRMQLLQTCSNRLRPGQQRAPMVTHVAQHRSTSTAACGLLFKWQRTKKRQDRTQRVFGLRLQETLLIKAQLLPKKYAEHQAVKEQLAGLARPLPNPTSAKLCTAHTCTLYFPHCQPAKRSWQKVHLAAAESVILALTSACHVQVQVPFVSRGRSRRNSNCQEFSEVPQSAWHASLRLYCIPRNAEQCVEIQVRINLFANPALTAWDAGQRRQSTSPMGLGRAKLWQGSSVRRFCFGRFHAERQRERQVFPRTPRRRGRKEEEEEEEEERERERQIENSVRHICPKQALASLYTASKDPVKGMVCLILLRLSAASSRAIPVAEHIGRPAASTSASAHHW